MRWFPVKSRLQHRFGREWFAELMSWHSTSKSEDGVMWFVHDSPAWKHVDATWPDFGSDPRNVRFGFSTDGVNPFKLNKTSQSTWPMALILYNIPPWLAMKKGHVILSILIPGTFFMFNSW